MCSRPAQSSPGAWPNTTPAPSGAGSLARVALLWVAGALFSSHSKGCCLCRVAASEGRVREGLDEVGRVAHVL